MLPGGDSKFPGPCPGQLESNQDPDIYVNSAAIEEALHLQQAKTRQDAKRTAPMPD